MKKKDYELIADVMKHIVVGKQGREAIEKLAGELAFAFQLQNPRFDKEKFLTACGIETEVKQ